MLRIYLVRHGETTWNREGRWQGHTDIPLSDHGIGQVERLRDRLASEVIDAIWSSDLKRASETAKIIAAPHGITVHTTGRLRETRLGDWEGLTNPEIETRGDGEILRSMARGIQELRPPNSESLQDMYDRMNSVLAEIKSEHTDGQVIIVGHGGSLCALICGALNAGVSCLNKFRLQNAALSALEYHEERVWIRFINDESHLRG